MSEKFDGLDIENMFAEAVEASENTGEKDPGLYGKNPQKTIKEIKKVETEIKKVETEIKKVETEIEQPKEIKKPIEPQVNKSISLTSIDKIAVKRIVEMKEILDNYDDKERTFIQGYFQQELGDYADIILSALTADQRGLEALNRIVIAKNNTAAERAFYLMELEIDDIIAIYEQINLLTGQLSNLDNISEITKISTCRLMEKTISEMGNNVFMYINKLQEFTNKAIL